jgi:hypothetical protein
LTAFLALAAIAGFAAIFSVGFYQTVTAPKGKPPTANSSLVYVSTGIAALVGGIVAVAFGQKPSPGPGPGAWGPSRPGVAAASLGSFVTGLRVPNFDWGAIIGAIYALTYVLFGLTAIVIWIIKPNETADTVKSLASTFFGLGIPIVRAYFS